MKQNINTYLASLSEFITEKREFEFVKVPLLLNICVFVTDACATVTQFR